jgi:hypothetical protein
MLVYEIKAVQTSTKEAQMNIQDTFRRAMEILEELEIEKDLRPAAFTMAVEALRTGQSPVQPMEKPAGASASGEAGDASSIETVARRLSLSRGQIEETYHFGEKGFELVAPGSKLAKSKSAGTKEIALVVAAGRQAAGIDDWTNMDDIREWSDHFRKLDAPNFAKAVADMSDVFRVAGKGSKRQVKLREPGWAKAKEVIERLLGANA